MGEKRSLRMSENRLLRRIFGPKRDEVTGEELSDLCSTTNIIRVNKSRRMRWADHVACIGERRVA
jgi:hypothetical protein